MEASKLLINEHPLQALPTLAKLVGLEKAVILQQIQYWISTSSHDIEGHKWIYNSYTEWSKQFPWLTAEGVRYHIRQLEKSGLIVAQEFNKDNRDKTKWYRVDYIELERVLNTTDGALDTTDASGKKLRMQAVKSYAPLPETNTTNTTETTSEKEEEKVSSPSPVTIIFDAIHTYYGYPGKVEQDPIPNYAKEGQFIKKMIARGFDTGQIFECWAEKTKKAGQYKSMAFVNEDIKVSTISGFNKFADQKYGNVIRR